MTRFPDLADLPDNNPAHMTIQDMLKSIPPAPPVYVPPALPDHNRRTAQNTSAMAMETQRLVNLTEASLALSQQMRDDTEKAQKDTHRMSVASLWVSAGSLALAAVSVVTAIIALVDTH
jgi:hypothetical protein